MKNHCGTLAYSINRLGACLTATLIALSANAAHTAGENKNVRSPFRVIWNYPDMSCQKNRIDFELSKFGIVANSPRSFIGNEIATIYASKIGLWPHYYNRHWSKPINGGLPQLANLTAHLEKTRKDITMLIGENSTGYGVIDQEFWRVLYDLNYWVFRVYRHASRMEVLRRDPTNKDPVNAAQEEFNKGAREIMERTLQEAQALRPGVHWGYYLYPQTWGINKTENINDRMAWLYRASTGLYPSIYIKNAKIAHSHMEQRIKDTLNEAIRVRSVHGRPNTPIIAYTVVQNDDFFFPKDILDHAIGQPAEMGIDGVNIWGSSRLFKPRPYEKCHAIKKYIHDILGPYVSQLLNRLTNCSVTKCGGRGRCVRKDYAKSMSDILAKESVKRQARAASSQATKQEFSDLSVPDYYQNGRTFSPGSSEGLMDQSESIYDEAWLGATEEPPVTEQSINDDVFMSTEQYQDSDWTGIGQTPARIIGSDQQQGSHVSSTSNSDSSTDQAQTSLFDLIFLNPMPTTTSATWRNIPSSLGHILLNNDRSFPTLGFHNSQSPTPCSKASNCMVSQGKANSQKYFTASHILPLKDEYENYSCECYDDWEGPSCKNSRI